MVAVIFIAGGAVIALSSGGGGKSKPTFKASTFVDLKAGPAGLTYTADTPQIQFPTDVRDAILQQLGTYVDEGTVFALRNGTADKKVLTVFDPGTAKGLTITGRASLFDEGFPKAVGKVEVTAQPVIFTGMVTPDQRVNLVVTAIAFDITARTETGVLTIKRTGQILFSRDLTGAWKILSYAIHVERDGPGVVPVPTVPAPGASTSAPTTAAAP